MPLHFDGLLCWTVPLLRKGFSRQFNDSDVPSVPDMFTMAKIILAVGHEERAVPLVVLLSVVLVAEGFIATNMRHEFADRLGAGIVATWTHLIFQKSLRLSANAPGSPLALIGNDVMRTYEMFKHLAWCLSTIVGMITGVVVLLLTIGPTSIVGIAVLASMLSVTSWMSRFVKAAEIGVLEGAEARVAMIRRIIKGIRAIKLSAWEDDFLARVTSLRQEECVHLTRYRIFYILGIQLGRASPVLAYTASFIFLGLAGTLETEDVFVALVIFQGFRVSLVMVPAGLAYISQFQVSARRVEDFLLQPELHSLAMGGQLATDAGGAVANLESAAFEWQSCTPSGKHAQEPGASSPADEAAAFQVRVPSLQLQAGRSFAVVGRVGSGKSSLLAALLGDLRLISGKAAVQRGLPVAYVPQKPFIIAGTVKDNILFGRADDEERLSAAIAGAALGQDLALLPGGLDTEIGENGVTLSGGQQQRVAIARALYTAGPCFLILDDPLAAVDMAVASVILRAVLARKAEGCTVLMALNQLPLLQSFDRVCVLADGALVQQGPPATITAEAGALRQMFDEAGHEARAGSAPVEDEAPPPVGRTASARSGGALVDAEHRSKGAIKSSVFRQYVLSMGAGNFALCLGILYMAAACLTFSDRWLAGWIASSQTDSEDARYVALYAASTLAYTALLCLASVGLSFACVRASRSLFGDCMQRLMHAPITFFEETPSGRILSRLSGDLGVVDVHLSQFLDHLLTFAAQLSQVAFIIIITAPPMVVVLVIAGLAYLAVVCGVERSSRQLKRMANNAQSPVLSLLGEALQGRLLLRAMRCDEAFTQRFAEAVDQLQSFNYCQTSMLHWAMFMTYFISAFISSATAMWLFTHGDESASGQAMLGLCMGYALNLPYMLLLSCFGLLTFKTQLASLERLLECRSTGVPQEPAWELPGDEALPEAWPLGQVAFQDAQLRYRPGLPCALRQVTFSVKPGERVGVVGRTGAGKSSLVVLLFRLREASGGKILMDGTDITKVGLRMLRRRMAVIPQESLLLEGTVRDNIDPFSRHTTPELQAALSRVGFPGGLLERHVGTGGQALSQGQHQLIALARALLRQASVVVLDEPTSSVDAATDAQIQKALREELKECTIFTIAHRLATVIDSDRILVLDAGEVKEFAPPAELCSRGGVFAEMVRAAGIAPHGVQVPAPVAQRGPPRGSEQARLMKLLALCGPAGRAPASS